MNTSICDSLFLCLFEISQQRASKVVLLSSSALILLQSQLLPASSSSSLGSNSSPLLLYHLLKPFFPPLTSLPSNFFSPENLKPHRSVRGVSVALRTRSL